METGLSASPPMTNWFDGHLDLAYLGVGGRDLRAPLGPDAPGACSFPDLRAGGVCAALGTIFTELGANPSVDPAGYRDSEDVEGAHRAGLRQLEWYEARERDGDLEIVRDAEHLDEALAGRRGRLAVVLLMECADPIRTPDEVAWWHARGLRVVGMSWAYGSRYSGGNARAGGVTPVGRRLVEALDACGILHDVSHLSRAAFDELLALTPRRVVATHSNAQALLPPNERHLTDAQIAAIRDRDGWIGLNLFGKFLADGRRATIPDCVAHALHVASIAGVGRVGLGSDLDGGFGREALPIGIRSPVDYVRLLEALETAGLCATAASRADYAHANLARVVRGALACGAGQPASTR